MFFGICREDYLMLSKKNSSSVEVARSFFSAYDQHEVEWMVEACTEDAELQYVPMGRHGQGPVRAVGKQFWSGLIDAFPDLHVTVKSAFGDDQNAAAEVTIGGTQHKNFLDIPNQSKHYELLHAFLLRLNDEGKITRVTAYWDNLDFYSQLGVEPLRKAA